jgi:hypothetical protein
MGCQGNCACGDKNEEIVTTPEQTTPVAEVADGTVEKEDENCCRTGEPKTGENGQCC